METLIAIIIWLFVSLAVMTVSEYLSERWAYRRGALGLIGRNISGLAGLFCIFLLLLAMGISEAHAKGGGGGGHSSHSSHSGGHAGVAAVLNKNSSFFEERFTALQKKEEELRKRDEELRVREEAILSQDPFARCLSRVIKTVRETPKWLRIKTGFMRSEYLTDKIAKDGEEDCRKQYGGFK